MSFKDQLPFFSDPPPWYYRMMAVFFGLGIPLIIFIMVLCLRGREYWPFLMFAPMLYFVILTIRNLLRSARAKENKSIKQMPTSDL